jgi:hypothetical protein
VSRSASPYRSRARRSRLNPSGVAVVGCGSTMAMSPEGWGRFRPRKLARQPPSAEDQGKGERNFHPFVEMIRLTLGVKTLQSVGIWRERAPQGGK